MSKAIDLGKRHDDLISPAEINRSEPYYPDIYISDVDDPGLMKIPDKGECTIRYRVRSRNPREEIDGKGKKKHSCSLRLEILSITPPEEKKKNGKTYGDDARKSFNEFFNGK